MIILNWIELLLLQMCVDAGMKVVHFEELIYINVRICVKMPPGCGLAYTLKKMNPKPRIALNWVI